MFLDGLGFGGGEPCLMYVSPPNASGRRFCVFCSGGGKSIEIKEDDFFISLSSLALPILPILLILLLFNGLAGMILLCFIGDNEGLIFSVSEADESSSEAGA